MAYPYPYFFTKNIVDREVDAADPEEVQQRQYHPPWHQCAVCRAICLSHPSHRGTSDSEPGLRAFRERQTATDFGLGLSLPVRLTLAAAARTRRPATGKVLRQVASSIFKLPSQSRSVLSHAFVRATKSRATLLTMLAAYMACLVYI